MNQTREVPYYGDDGRLCEIFSTLLELMGSEPCAEELILAANEVETTCAGAALTPMPHWIN